MTALLIAALAVPITRYVLMPIFFHCFGFFVGITGGPENAETAAGCLVLGFVLLMLGVLVLMVGSFIVDGCAHGWSHQPWHPVTPPHDGLYHYENVK